MERLDRNKVRERFRAKIAARVQARQQDERDAAWDLVVTCHSEYLGAYLNECLSSWEREKVPGRKILVLDDCGLTPAIAKILRPSWEVVSGKWGNPSGPRNAGLQKVDAEWVVFWDADNVPRKGLAKEFSRAAGSAALNVGYIGTSVPDGDPRDSYGCDTNSLWRAQAVRDAGGWSSPWVEDWRLGWSIAAEGWQIVRMEGEPIERRRHKINRTNQATEDEKLWAGRDFAIVSLHRGDYELSKRWIFAVGCQELPPNVAITLVSDGDVEFSDWLASTARAVLGPFGGEIRLIQADNQPLPAAGISELSARQARHRRVFDHYQRAMQATPEPWFYTWEDDVFPSCPETLRKMSAFLLPGPRGKRGVVGATYAERYKPQFVCASRSADGWQGDILLADVTAPTKVGSTAAGLTLWRRSDWESMTEKANDVIGWDFAMNRAARKRGAESWLLPDICEHATGAAPEPVKLAAIDRPSKSMLKNQILQLVLPALVAQLIRVLDEDKIKSLADDLIRRLEAAVLSTPTKVDDATVLPLAKHIRTLLD